MTDLIESKLKDEIITYRHQFHEHPELANQEVWTTAKIKEILESWHINLRPSKLKTGVFAEIGANNPGPTLALRADIDALPIQEESGVDFSSQNPGVMHACGHDTHIAALLGAAYLLKQQENKLAGKIRLIFQLAEEDKEGALQVIQDGQLAGVDAIVGFHNVPNHPVGTIGIKSGITSGAIDKFKVYLAGVGAHASTPQASIDSITALGYLITELQSLVSRNLDPFSPAVLSITQVAAGNTWNVLPEKSFLQGTVRTADKTARSLIKKRFFEIVTAVAQAHQVKADIDWYEGDPSVDNDPKLTDLVADESRRFAKVYQERPALGSDDFACFQELVPGVYAKLGNGEQVGAHNPHFKADDDVAVFGTRYFYAVSKRLLKELKK